MPRSPQREAEVTAFLAARCAFIPDVAAIFTAIREVLLRNITLRRFGSRRDGLGEGYLYP